MYREEEGVKGDEHYHMVPVEAGDDEL
jgi:hypothetical protein